MSSLRNFAVTVVFGVGCACNSAVAAYLDFTDSDTINALNAFSAGPANGFTGQIDGVNFTLSALDTDGVVNFSEGYDGSLNTGCQANGGPLKCDKDGAGIGNDEITGLAIGSGQTLSLVFETDVYISSLDFLDVYRNPDGKRGEQATISIEGSLFTANAIETSGQGGYVNLDLLSLGGPVLGNTILFTANPDSQFWDDHNNDYAFAGMQVSAVPVPAAMWLFGTALLGLAGFGRKRSLA